MRSFVSVGDDVGDVEEDEDDELLEDDEDDEELDEDELLDDEPPEGVRVDAGCEAVFAGLGVFSTLCVSARGGAVMPALAQSARTDASQMTLPSAVMYTQMTSPAS